jgi:TolB-like protein/Tfp pilus assembly protein PilF
VLGKLLSELRQRHVLRVAGLYVVGGWPAFQVVNSLFPALNLPAWSVTLVAVLFLLGLPVAMIIAYAFESTPEGVRRAAPPDPARAGAPLTWFDWSLLAASIAIVALAVTQFVMRSTLAPQASASQGGAPASIAVLPFVNFSDASDAEYFADGLTEELINGLAQLPDLKVVGRTSTFYFKGRNEDLREIGRKLGVAHVLEGSVRRSGERLRVTAQLVSVSDGFHLWSQTYDQPMSDAFVVQTQIAESVARALKARLLAPADPKQKARDPRAYQLELVARAHLRKHELTELEAARASYEELLKIEPDNADALAGYAHATIFLAQDFMAVDFDTARQESEAAVERALAIDPKSANAWRVKGVTNHILSMRTSDRRYSELAETALRRAVEIDPEDADSLEMLANELLGNGQTAQAMALLQRALGLEPLSRVSQTLLGSALAAQGRFAEARRQYESLIALYPDFTTARISLGRLLYVQGRLDDAADVFADENLIRTDPIAGFLLANVYANLGMTTEMTEVLEGIREPPTAATLARAVLLLRSAQLDALSRLATEQLADTHDPIWSAVGVVSRVVAGDVGSARALIADAMPGLQESPPATLQYKSIDALLAAYALRETGWPDQAALIANAIIENNDTSAQEYEPVEEMWLRVLAFAVLDRTDESIAELQRAVDHGYRTLIDFEYFVRLQDYPLMANVVSDARFQALVARIEADNRRMRDALLARRAQAETTTTAN